MNNALNRDRGDVQSVFRVTHPEAKGHFAESGEKIRQIRSQGVKLHDMAVYVSAYEVASGLIDTFESVLIRSFANDLLNVKMEKFGGEPQKPNTKVKKKLLKKSP
jgi:hypothetical protein